MGGLEYLAVFTRERSAGRDGSADVLRLAWSEDDWQKLLLRTEPQVFRSGDIVIQRGGSDRGLRLIAAGSLEVGLYRAEGVPIARIGVGSVAGEQAFFDGQPRSMNVWAVSDGALLRLTLDAFEAFGREEPALARDLLFALGRVLSLRLRHTTKA